MDRSRRKGAVLARRREWAGLYAYGFSLVEIGNLYGYNHVSVMNQIKKAGIRCRNAHRAAGLISEKHRDGWTRWADMYASGKSIREIATTVSVHKDTVRKAFSRLGVVMREPISRPTGVVSRSGLTRARTEYLRAAQQKRSPKIERMMSLACPKRKRYAA